jgi:hypothetical protein
LSVPLFTGRLSLPALKCGTPICLNRDFASVFLPGIAFNIQILTDLSLAAPLFTGRIYLPVLKGKNPIAFTDLASSLLLGLTFKL